MRFRHRGVVIAADHEGVIIQADEPQPKGGYMRHVWPHDPRIVGLYAPGHDARPGDWVDVDGGGFAGLYRVTRLAVFA